MIDREGLSCPCGGCVRYFGEALMGSLKCDDCGAFLMGVGDEFLATIDERWNRGDRGASDCDKPRPFNAEATQ